MTMETIARQLGEVQTGLDRGLGALEKALDRQSDQLGGRLEKIEDHQRNSDMRIERFNGRLDALEEFRKQAEATAREETKAQVSELRGAVVDQSQLRTLRWVGGTAVAILGAIVTILAIVQALGS